MPDDLPETTRHTTLVTPRVLTIPTRLSGFTMRFAQPGTVALLLANAEGRETLDAIAAAVERDDLAEVERLHTGVRESFTRGLLTSDREALAAEHERTHAAFVHGRRRVVLGMFTPKGMPVAHSLALLDGTEVDPSTFAVAVSQQAGVDEQLFALAVVRPAVLTRLEREIVRVTPPQLGRLTPIGVGSRGVEIGFWTEGYVARFAADIGERAIEWAAGELGIAEQIHQAQAFVGDVEHAAADFVGAGLDAVGGIVHGLAQAAGIDGIIQAGADVVGAVIGAVNAVDNAVNGAVDAVANVAADAAGAVVDAAAGAVGAAADAVVGAADAVVGAVDAAADAVGDVVGAAVDWVADNILGGGDIRLQEQFERAALAQRTFQQLVTAQVDTNVTQLTTVTAGASLQQLLQARTQIVAAAAQTPRVSLLGRRTR